jgi:hypothetical protein
VFAGRDCYCHGWMIYPLSVTAMHAERRAGRNFMECVFAARVALWLCVLPVRIRMCSLPVLLRKIAKSKARKSGSKPSLRRSIDVAVRVCNLRVFSLPCFPRACLKQSLVLYRELTRLRCPAVIHFGVQMQGQALTGHSWVTVDGNPVAEPGPVTAYSKTYSFPD